MVGDDGQGGSCTVGSPVLLGGLLCPPAWGLSPGRPLPGLLFTCALVFISSVILSGPLTKVLSGPSDVSHLCDAAGVPSRQRKHLVTGLYVTLWDTDSPGVSGGSLGF